MRSKFKDMIFVKGGKYTPCFTDDEKKFLIQKYVDI